MSLRRVGTPLLRVGSLLTATAAALSLGVTAAHADPAPPAARYVSTMTVPDNFIPAPVRWGGISGLDNIGGGNYVGISDDPGRFGPARYFQFRLPTSGTGIFTSNTPVLTGGGTVLAPNNLPLLPGQMDMEGIRRLGPNYVISSEGARPWIRVVTPLGIYVRDLRIPSAYIPGPGKGMGVNDGFEGLAVTPGGTVAAMTEEALRQDGGAPTTTAGTSSRLAVFGPRGTAEYVYKTDPLARGASRSATKGVSEILAVTATDFYVLERGYDPATNRNDVKVYLATTRGATQVGGRYKLSGSETVMRKRLIFDFGMLPLLRSDNVEGMAYGPRLADGRRTLVLVSDDNFATPRQHTKFHLLALS
ncbi:MAG: esterase-like activity of phytase family protein [Gordonia paraffinivorans]